MFRRCRWKLHPLCALLCLVFGISSTLAAQNTTQTYPVHGVVLNRLNHQPIVRALVEEQSDAVLTDSNGRFELQLPAQMVTITARRPGYTAEDSTTIKVSADLPDIALYLTPQAAITGHLELSDESDPSGIQIMAYRSRMHHGVRTWDAAGIANARSDGSFRLPVQQVPGVFLLITTPSAESNGLEQNSTGPIFGYPAVSLPQGAYQSSVGGLSVGIGQQLNVNMSVVRQPFQSVTITVKGLPEVAAANLRIVDENGILVPAGIRWSNANRQAGVQLPDGQYSAIAEFNGQTRAYGRTDFHVSGAPVSGISLVVLPLMPIPVSVHRNFTESASPAQVLTGSPAPNERAQDPGINVVLEPVDSQSGNGGNLQMRPGSSDRSSLELVGAEPGRYWVMVFPQEGYAGSVRSGGVDLAKEPLVVGPGGASQPIDITVRNDTGQIGCTIANQTVQAASAIQAVTFVYAIAQFSTSVPSLRSVANSGSETLISQVPPGTYRVIALDAGVAIDTLDPEVLERYLVHGKTVTVEAGSKATVSLNVSHVSTGDIAADEDSED